MSLIETVLREVLTNPGRTRKQIAETLAREPSTVSVCLLRLKREAFVVTGQAYRYGRRSGATWWPTAQ